jgi:hypothetical protein
MMQEVHMTRFALAVAVALSLTPSLTYAQHPRFTVTARSASIYEAPTVVSPVIAQSPQGAVLDVRRELPDWIEVAWPSTAKGIAYLRASTGVQRPMTIDEFVHGTSVQTPPSASGSPDQSAAYVAEAVAAVSAASTTRPNVTASNAAYVAPTHFVGLGGRIADPTRRVGGTGRFWSRAGVGVQFEMLRDARTLATFERVTSLQFAPSVLYALPNAVSDYFWLRPYVGGGATIDRWTLRSADSTEISASSSHSLGLQLFGGGELTFAGLPRFALSADVGYRKMQTGLAGVEHRKIRFALSGHWFVR